MLDATHTGTVTEQQAKSRIYSFLAVVLGSHPRQDHIHALGEMAEQLGVPLPVGFSLAQLDQEYMNLFVVPNPRYTAPYESVYRDAWLAPGLPSRGGVPGATSSMIKGLLMGESTLKVGQCYTEARVSPSEDLPDHIANELRLMAYLSAPAADTLPAEAPGLDSLRTQVRVEHLLEWIGQLRVRVMESAHLAYYPAALEIAELVLNDDH